jgi:hypothetical protein
LVPYSLPVAAPCARLITITVHADGKKPSNVHELKPKQPEAEKITINLGYVDLGHVDLMVQDGF